MYVVVSTITYMWDSFEMIARNESNFMQMQCFMIKIKFVTTQNSISLANLANISQFTMISKIAKTNSLRRVNLAIRVCSLLTCAALTTLKTHRKAHRNFTHSRCHNKASEGDTLLHRFENKVYVLMFCKRNTYECTVNSKTLKMQSFA